MGRKLDALLGRRIKTYKFKPIVNLAVSRLAVLKNQRQARLSVARSDLLQLLKHGHHERALLRVEQVIKEQNMLDAFAMIDSYCDLLIERTSLVEQSKECPDELKEAISGLLYAATRCGEFPELQEIRAGFTSHFGKEFAARAIELRNNCGVNPKIIQKLSTRQPSLESKMKVLKEIASENGIVLQIEDIKEPSSVTTEGKSNDDQKQNRPELKDESRIMAEERDKVEDYSDSMKGRRKYRDVADAAQAAFESAAYAAAAARAAVELSRFRSFDPDDQNSPSSQPRTPNRSKLHKGGEKVSRENEDVDLGSEKNYHSESEEEEIYRENKAEGLEKNKDASELKRSVSSSSSDSAEIELKGNILPSNAEGQTKPLKADIVFDESDDEPSGKHSSITNEIFRSEKANTVMYDEDIPQRSGGELLNPKLQSPEGSRKQGVPRLNLENRPISVRTKLMRGR